MQSDSEALPQGECNTLPASQVTNTGYALFCLHILLLKNTKLLHQILGELLVLMQFISSTGGHVYICIMAFCRSQSIRITQFQAIQKPDLILLSFKNKMVCAKLGARNTRWYKCPKAPTAAEVCCVQKSHRQSAMLQRLCQSSIEKNVTLEPLAAVCR